MVDLSASEARTFAVFSLATPTTPVSQARALGVINFPTPHEYISAAKIFAVLKSQNKPVEISQARVMAVVKGRIANPRVRAWTFTLDGHDFYVLRLGDYETLVYDTASQKWTTWDSLTSGAWRPNIGTTWVGAQLLASRYGSAIVAGDDTFGLLWFLDPNNAWDDATDATFRKQQIPYTRVATGQVTVSGRQNLPCYALFVDTDNYGLVADDFSPQVVLETSDDQGRTWDAHDTLTVPGVPQENAAYTWYSLGQISSPGRLFRLTDNGLIARIDTMSMNDDAG